jgi:hypothetical protein
MPSCHIDTFFLQVSPPTRLCNYNFLLSAHRKLYPYLDTHLPVLILLFFRDKSLFILQARATISSSLPASRTFSSPRYSSSHTHTTPLHRLGPLLCPAKYLQPYLLLSARRKLFPHLDKSQPIFTLITHPPSTALLKIRSIYFILQNSHCHTSILSTRGKHSLHLDTHLLSTALLQIRSIQIILQDPILQPQPPPLYTQKAPFSSRKSIFSVPPFYR